MTKRARHDGAPPMLGRSRSGSTWGAGENLDQLGSLGNSARKRWWRMNGARPATVMESNEAEPRTSRQNLRDALLIALTVASGAVDAISYFGLGKVFSAFMTGNIVFLGFGIVNMMGPLVPVVLALSMFAVGAYLGLRIVTSPAQRSDLWPVRVSLVLALVAVLESGFLVVWWATAGKPSTEIADVLIVLFSSAMGIQTAAVRMLHVDGVFTTAGTFTLVAFVSTIAGSRPRREMPRLVGVLLGLVAGAIAGGLLFRYARSYAPLLPLAITILASLTGWAMHRSPQRLPRNTQ